MSEAAAARTVPHVRGALVALVLALAAVAVNLTASFAGVDDLYGPALVLGVAAIVLGMRARRGPAPRLATAAVVLGLWAPGTTLVYLVVIGLQELF